MKKNIQTKSDDLFEGRILHRYTRAQALAEGTLIDLSCFEEFSGMWKPKAACTVAVWGLIQATLRKQAYLDLTGILWDISCMARFAASHAGDADTLRFDVTIGCTVQHLKMILGPGDTPEAVLTLMLANEG